MSDISYKILLTETGDITPCYDCYSEVETYPFTKHTPKDNKPYLANLCEYCANASGDYAMKMLLAQMFHTLEKRMKDMRALVLVLVMFALAGCSVVGPGERGIRISLGKASNDVKESGAYLWIPFFLGMQEMNVQTQKSEVETSAASKDMQEITTHLAINWSITPDQVVTVYKNIGDEEDVLLKIISPATNEVMKAATAKKTAEEILIRRTELKVEIDTELKKRLEHYGVTLADVSITNLTFSKEFTDAIEQKQIAEQKAKQAEYTALQAIQEAKAQVNRAEGQAKAQALLRESLTPAILQKMAIDKWLGQVPTYYSGNGQNLPFILVK